MNMATDDLQTFANRLADASGAIIRRRFREAYE